MNRKAIHQFIVFIIVFSISCNFGTGLSVSAVGPKNFTAALTAPDVVLLTWAATEGATGYILELSIDNGESIQIVALPPDRTSYEDLSAPEKSNLTYQVQVVTESGLAGKSKIDIETGERQPNPVTVKPEYDEKNAVVATIGAQGGTVSLVDSNKVEYALVIPEGALSADTEIRMTAVPTIRDWPLDGNAIGAVRLEPEGLILNDAATLTIGIPVDLHPNLAIVGFAFQEDGREFHLQPSYEVKGLTDNLPSAGGHLVRPVFQESKHIVRMAVVELKVVGLGETAHESVAALTKDHGPTSAAAALEQKWAAETIADDALAPLENAKGWKSPPKARMQGQEIAKEFVNANNCKELIGLMGSFNIWVNELSLSDLTGDQQKQYSRQAWDELSNKVKEILENTATECEKSSQPGGSAPAESPCAKALLERIANPGTSSFNLKIRNIIANKLSNKDLQGINDNLEKCKPKAYHISGAFGELGPVEGNACDVTKPFTMSGATCMFFTPADENGGSFTYACGPLGAGGSGTYIIGNGSMQISGSGSLGANSNSGSLTFAVTSIDPASCIP